MRPLFCFSSPLVKSGVSGILPQAITNSSPVHGQFGVFYPVPFLSFSRKGESASFPLFRTSDELRLSHRKRPSVFGQNLCGYFSTLLLHSPSSCEKDLLTFLRQRSRFYAQFLGLVPHGSGTIFFYAPPGLRR